MGKKLVFSILCVVFIVLVINSFGDDNIKMKHRNHGSVQKYFIEMDKKTQKAFFQRINRIKYGDSIMRIKEIIGEPTCDKKLVGKTGEFKARVLEYYIKKLDKDLVNEKYDKSVRFIFNRDDKLTEIESNVEGFKYAPK